MPMYILHSIWLDGTCIENYRNLRVNLNRNINKLNQVQLPPPHPHLPHLKYAVRVLGTRVIYFIILPG